MNNTSPSKLSAEDTIKAKNKFISDMGHELRTPLNAILGLSELMLEDAKDANDENYLEPLARIHKSGILLLRLINNLIDLAKIDAGIMQSAIEEYDVATIIQEIQQKLQPQLTAKQNEFKLTCPDDIGKIKTDLSKFKKILNNLLSNACQFTNKGEIILEVSKERKDNDYMLKFKISDAGCGIDPGNLAKILTQFNLPAPMITNETGNPTLGLLLAQRLCQFLHGSLTINSEVGKGTTCIVMLPVTGTLPA